MSEEQFAALKPTDPQEPSMQDLRSLQCRVLITVQMTFMGKEWETVGIYKTNSGEHLHLLDQPPSFV